MSAATANNNAYLKKRRRTRFLLLVGVTVAPTLLTAYWIVVGNKESEIFTPATVQTKNTTTTTTTTATTEHGTQKQSGPDDGTTDTVATSEIAQATTTNTTTTTAVTPTTTVLSNSRCSDLQDIKDFKYNNWSFGSCVNWLNGQNDQKRMKRRCQRVWEGSMVREYWCRKTCSELLLEKGECFDLDTSKSLPVTISTTNNNKKDDTSVKKQQPTVTTATSTVWWEEHIESLVTVYQQHNSTDWCAPGTPLSVSLKAHKMVKTGLYLTKLFKAASSTAASVSIQIAEAIAHRKNLVGCPFHVGHGAAHRRRQAPNFSWTVVRNPHKRVISWYFFKDISRQKQEYNSTDLITTLQINSNYMMEYIGDYDFDEKKPIDREHYRDHPQRSFRGSHRGKKGKKSTTRPTLTQPEILDRLADIFDDYDFIAVTERMDESLVVMKLLFDLPDESIVVFNSKQSGGFDDGNYKNRCHKIQKSYTTPDVDAFIRSDDYQRNNADYFLYELANRSLDRTIDALGRERVKAGVKRLQFLRKLAEDSCLSTTVFPCEEDMKPTNINTSCYFGDWGCGHDCTMAVVRNAARGNDK